MTSERADSFSDVQCIGLRFQPHRNAAFGRISVLERRYYDYCYNDRVSHPEANKTLTDALFNYQYYYSTFDHRIKKSRSAEKNDPTKINHNHPQKWYGQNHFRPYRRRRHCRTAEDLLYVPKPKCETFRNSLAYSGAKIWNSLPVNVKSAKSIEQFKDRYIQWASTS